MKEIDYDELEKFHQNLFPITKGKEAYVLVLIADTTGVVEGGYRGIVETILIKSNSFIEFKRKVEMLNKKSFDDISSECLELYLDVNPKDYKTGLKQSCEELDKMIENDEDLGKFTNRMMRNIRRASRKDLTVIKSGEQEYHTYLTVTDGENYYMCGYYELAIGRKRNFNVEIPVAGVELKGNMVRTVT